MYGWTEKTSLLYASCRLNGAAREWFNGFRSTINTYVSFKRDLLRAFPDHRNEADIHQELQRVNKNANESYESFVFWVNAIGINGGVSTEAIIVYVIRGLSHDPIYDSLISRQYNDIYELLQHVKWCESNIQHRKKKGGNYTLSNSKKTSDVHTDIKPFAAKPRGEFVCYNCNET